jgi:hypothetical protein
MVYEYLFLRGESYYFRWGFFTYRYNNWAVIFPACFHIRADELVTQGFPYVLSHDRIVTLLSGCFD